MNDETVDLDSLVDEIPEDEDVDFDEVEDFTAGHDDAGDDDEPEVEEGAPVDDRASASPPVPSLPLV